MKKILASLALFAAAAVSFVVSLTLAGVLLPMSEAILAATPKTGILSLGAATVVNAVANAALLLWMARRSPRRGAALWRQLFLVHFGLQTLQTQIETGYFLPAFPLLHGSFELYMLVLRGGLTSLLFTLAVTALSGGFGRKPRPESAFAAPAEPLVREGAWLAGVYAVLYFLFGYFVAWQWQEVRVFYGGPAELNSFGDQMTAALIGKPESPVFQYFRGWLWLACLLPLFRGFRGTRGELVLLAGLLAGLLPTVQLAFPNPLMPPAVSLAHFWEVSISTGIFGALCAWRVPRAHVVAYRPESSAPVTA